MSLPFMQQLAWALALLGLALPGLRWLLPMRLRGRLGLWALAGLALLGLAGFAWALPLWVLPSHWPEA